MEEKYGGMPASTKAKGSRRRRKSSGRVKTNSNSNKKIPAFGDWDYANDMPITQYFDSPRQAGLIKIRPSSDDCEFNYIHPVPVPIPIPADFYAASFSHQQYPPHYPAPQPRHLRNHESRWSHQHPPSSKDTMMMVMSKQQQHGGGKVSDNNSSGKDSAAVMGPSKPKLKPKPVDEDLYKIPPDLLHSSSLPATRKKKLGFIARCLVPCAA